MKIKAVCEATGLTDRAVRYYIEEGLIAPTYTENYLGRKNFDFSDEDVTSLERIAVLRKYDFSVAEIKQMNSQPEVIECIYTDLISRKGEKLDADSAILEALEKLPEAKPQSVGELVSVLEKPSVPLPSADEKPVKRTTAVTVLRMMIVLLPIVLAAIMVLANLHAFRYGVIKLAAILIMLALLLPSALLFFIPKLIKRKTLRHIVTVFLAALCVLSLPFIFIYGVLMIGESHADRVYDYRLLDNNVRVLDEDVFFNKLFPPRAIFLNDPGSDRSYYYSNICGIFDSEVEIFAEKKLDDRAFDYEVLLKKTEFEGYYSIYAEKWRVYGGQEVPNLKGYISLRFKEFERGAFKCLAFYTNVEPFESCYTGSVFYIFAYDEETKTVRWIYYNCRDDGSDQPRFYSLDW